MAYSALVSLAQTTHLILNPHKYSISVYAKKEITSVRKLAISLISFLEDFPQRANSLEGKIRDVATEAEGIIELFMWEQLDESSCCFGPSPVEFEQQLKRVRGDFGSIDGDMMDDLLTDSPAAVTSASRLASTGKNDRVIGLDEELIAIKLRLCGESSKLEVIPILGMGGIGKTTLVRCAYDDRLTVEHFHIRAWITISQDYSAQEIISCLRDSLKSFDDQMSAHENQIILREKVYKCLKGRRYLIVMDDVWSTKALDDVKNIFPDDHNGSRIILTTRLSDVATYAISSSSLVHEMKFMDDDECLNLLKQKVFANENGQGCPSELEDVAKEIARSCRGLPLAVVLVAGVLSKIVETRASWEEILKNLNSIVGKQSEEILSLSYTYLSHNLRSCFLYLGGFPEDQEVRVSKLIKLWVAEGFLKCTNESISVEEEAEEYLEDLVERSLVLVSSRKSNGKIKSCSLHDLVRDLCIRKAREEKFLVHATDGCADVRRLSNNFSNLYNICGSTIRTILCFQQPQESCSSLPNLSEEVKLLRVLELANDSDEHLSFQIFEQFHLRYLSSWKLTNIHPTISKLENLQTLIINRKANPIDRRLPIQIWRMPQLRHLVVYYLYKLPFFPPSTLPLENVQTLLVVRGSERFLKMFPNVKKLGLIYDRSDAHCAYELHNLTHLDQLEKLKIIMGDSCHVGRNPAFPRTLKKLTLSGGAFPWKDLSIIGSLPNLEVLKLISYACDGDTWETVDGEFTQLRFLLIEKSNLRDWITECSHFPSLKCLILRLCQSLNEIPDGIAEIPSLEMIEVDYQNKRLRTSAKEILEDQLCQGNDNLQVRVVGFFHESFYVEKTSGKKSYMIGAMALIFECGDGPRWQWKPCADSRFSVVAYLKEVSLDISVKIKTHILSSNTTYAPYLLFKLAEEFYENESVYASVLLRRYKGYSGRTHKVVYLQQREDAGPGPEEQHGRYLLQRGRVIFAVESYEYPVRRDDGWMEVEMGTFYNEGADDDAEAEARLTMDGLRLKSGIIIEGIEFRPKP